MEENDFDHIVSETKGDSASEEDEPISQMRREVRDAKNSGTLRPATLGQPVLRSLTSDYPFPNNPRAGTIPAGSRTGSPSTVSQSSGTAIPNPFPGNPFSGPVLWTPEYSSGRIDSDTPRSGSVASDQGSMNSAMTGTTGMTGMSSVMSFDLPMSSAAKSKLARLERIVSSGTITGSFSSNSNPSRQTSFDVSGVSGQDYEIGPGASEVVGSMPVSILELPGFVQTLAPPNAYADASSHESSSNNRGVFHTSPQVSLRLQSSLGKRFAEEGAGAAADTKCKAPPRRRKSELIARLNGNKNFSLIPSIEELCDELEVAPEALERSKRNNYQRKFRLWMPMVHEYNQEDEEEEEMEEIDMLPVDELLDRAMLRRVRIAAVERSLFFLIFILLYCTMMVLQRDLANSYQLESALRAQIEMGDTIKFSDVQTIDDVWEWMQTSLVNNVVPGTSWNNGERLEGNNEEYSFFYNKQCGGLDLVQHRVRSFSAKRYTPSFTSLYPKVWPDLGGPTSTAKTIGGANSGDDRKPFGPSDNPGKYTWQRDLAGEFDGGGYMVRFPMASTDELGELMEELKADSFFDKQTRNIMIVGTVFNANLKLFSVIEFNIHLNAAGLLSSSTNISSVRVDSFVGARDWFRLGVEIVVVVIMLYHSWSEFVTAITVGFSNYMNFWNAVDSLRQVLFYYCMISYIMLMVDPIRRNPQDVVLMCRGEGESLSLLRLARMETEYVFISALFLLSSTLLIFKFLTPFPKVGIFVHTMVAAGVDLFNFTIILLILLFGFAIIGHLLFGHVLEGYSTVTSSMEAAIYIAIGEFEYASLVSAASGAAAAIYFYSFMFIITIVGIQMVIAIIFSAYDGLREKIDEAEELEVGPTIIRAIVLGREPSFAETSMPLYKLLVARLRNSPMFAWKFYRRAESEEDQEETGSRGCLPFGRRHKVNPTGNKGKKVTPEMFGDAHLMQMFDGQYVFRYYGILSPKLESAIVKIKNQVSAQRAAAKLERPRSRSGLGLMSFVHVKSQESDPWALDKEEFCALLHLLDDEDDSLQIDISKTAHYERSGKSYVLGEDSNEMKIAHYIFAAYGRAKKERKQQSFRKRVDQKLDLIMKFTEPEEYKKAREAEENKKKTVAEKRRRLRRNLSLKGRQQSYLKPPSRAGRRTPSGNFDI